MVMGVHWAAIMRVFCHPVLLRHKRRKLEALDVDWRGMSHKPRASARPDSSMAWI